MGPKSPEDILGFEFDWLASDADGHVAFFSTAGGGYAPEEFLQDTDVHDAAIDAILASPVRTRARFAPEVHSDAQNTWKLMAERGLFAFDSDAHGGPYRLVAAPESPIRIADLPETIGSIVGRIVLRGLSFVQSREIATRLLRDRP
jgi:hypothetical protein